jgi:hypothetical protein
MFAVLFKLALVGARTRQGRRLALLAGLAALRLARSQEARRVYATVGQQTRALRPRRLGNRALGVGIRRARRRTRRRTS